MYDKLSQAAETVATNVSRRAFLGRLGRGALAMAGVLATTLAAPRIAQAGNLDKKCVYRCPSGPRGGFYVTHCSACDKACPKHIGTVPGCIYVSESACTGCP
jgi:hypothetical protein